jgi:hypothetical protein
LNETTKETVSPGTNNSNWISTVILKLERGHCYSEEISKEINFQILSNVISDILNEVEGDGIILFPAGLINTGNDRAKVYREIVRYITPLLKKEKRKVFVCIGIVGDKKDGLYGDQIALAIDKNGIQAAGKKFCLTKKEKGYVTPADNYLVGEDGFSRTFALNGVRYYLSVCYDIFGLKEGGIENKNTDVILNLVHCFCPKGRKDMECEEKSGVSSGDSYYARHGFGGASKKWACPVFGAAVFFGRKVPEKWPSGVMWNGGDKSTKYCNYKEISLQPTIYLQPTDIFNKNINECTAHIRIYCN